MVKGTLRFGVPDESVPASERAFFATPSNKDFVLQEVELYGLRVANDVVKGSEGLDIQGFAWLHHHSSIVKSGQLFEGRNVEDVYLPEIEQLMEEVTGAKRAVVWNGITRRKLPYHQDSNPMIQHKRGSKQDQVFDGQPRDLPFSACSNIACGMPKRPQIPTQSLAERLRIPSDPFVMFIST